MSCRKHLLFFASAIHFERNTVRPMPQLPRSLPPVLFACVCMLVASCSSKPKMGPNVIDPDAPKEFTTTDSGLKYRILRKSTGEKPIGSSTVVVDYSGWLDNGTVFDTSYNNPRPASFPLSGVVEGWTEGLQLVGVGGMIELELPPELAYGDKARPGIPANSTLHFKIELHEIK